MNNTGGTTYIFSHPFMRFVPDFFLFVLLKFYNKRKIKRLPDGGDLRAKKTSENQRFGGFGKC